MRSTRASKRIGCTRSPGTAEYIGKFPRLVSDSNRTWIDKLTLCQIGPLPARISLTLSLPALAPDDGVDVPVDDLGILVLEVALVGLEVFGVQLQAVAPPVRGDGFGGVDRDASLEQDVDEEFADFAERGVVGGHRC
jgi:hypothetical protein